jgi:glycogen debranching enzyme
MIKSQSYPCPGESWSNFVSEADRFIDKTAEFVHLGVNPGDYYKAIWTRDAAFILKDQFLMGDTTNVLKALYFIWTHQINLNGEKIIYGRGSPELGFLVHNADLDKKEQFKGALPSTIYHNQGFSEVYARNPDIDSTALMISTTSWILDVYLKAGLYSYDKSPVGEPTERPLSSADERQNRSSWPLATSKTVSKPTELLDFIVPRMLDAVEYLAKRDMDNDGLLEQGYNEDWMDTALRAGKLVYSQACWILALSNFSSLLYEISQQSLGNKLIKMAEKTVNTVEELLWSEEEGAYVDLKFDGDNDKADRMLTQDVSLYLVSVTENTLNDILSLHFKGKTDGLGSQQKQEVLRPRVPNKNIERRALSTFEAIRDRLWMGGMWPLITERELTKTGPWVLDPNQYHNHTFWPWITGIEMLARSRFKRNDECYELLSAMTRENQSQSLAYHEWINPVTGKGGGAFPFRTGISSIRIALTDILLSRA